MTNDIGAALRAAREQQGLSLDQAAEGTRIRPHFLRALEENDYETLGGEVYVRGFLRNYATFLGLDPDPLLPAPKATIPIVPPNPERETEILSVPLQDTHFPIGRILFMALLFVSLALLAYYLWQPAQRAALLQRFGGYLPLPMPTLTVTPVGSATVITLVTPQVQLTQTESVSVATTPTTPTTTPVPTATLPPRTPTPDLTATAQPTETPVPVPTATGITLRLTYNQPSWTEIYVDSNESATLAETLGEGATYEVVGQQSVFLRLGNAGGVVVTLNGQELGTMGSPGAVVNRLWLFDSATGQVVEATPVAN